MNVKEILEKYDIHPQKRLGQSFLISEKIANRIVLACKIEPQDIILEVGAGLGILTKYLCEKRVKVFAIEKDPMLFEVLSSQFRKAKNLILLNQDILSISLKDFDFGDHKIKIISNLPYSITSDFLYWVLENKTFISLCVLMLQKEVAQKIYAPVGDKSYGAISVFFQFYMNIRPLFWIKGGSFFPKSKVTSQIISLEPKTYLPKVNEEKFFKIVHRVFAERRKKLKNSLRLKANTIGGIDLSRRPESLNYKEFVRLVNEI
jgi:16S rRNA (adenine1518-N6/adenine1519-N6)-dimethyltransferase